MGENPLLLCVDVFHTFVNIFTRALDLDLLNLNLDLDNTMIIHKQKVKHNQVGFLIKNVLKLLTLLTNGKIKL